MISDLKAVAFDDNPKETVRAALSRRPALDLTLQEEADTSGGRTKSQHLLIGPPDKRGKGLGRDPAWRPSAAPPPPPPPPGPPRQRQRRSRPLPPCRSVDRSTFVEPGAGRLRIKGRFGHRKRGRTEDEPDD